MNMSSALISDVFAAGSGCDTLSLLDELFGTISNIVYFAKDIEGRYIRVNRTLCDRCGVSSMDELIGKTAADVFAGEMGRSYLKQDLDLIKTAKKISEKLELHLYRSRSTGRRGNGEQGWCLTSKIPLFDSERKVIGLIGISQDLPGVSCSNNHYPEISIAIEYIQQHYGESISVAYLADMSGLSVYQFEKRVKGLFQITAGRFIIKTRIGAGCELLRGSKKSIVDIAIECGYTDQSAFSRQFKSVTGLTPGAYRSAYVQV